MNMVYWYTISSPVEVTQKQISHTDLFETWHNNTFCFSYSTDKLAIIWGLLAVFLLGDIYRSHCTKKKDQKCLLQVTKQNQHV